MLYNEGAGGSIFTRGQEHAGLPKSDAPSQNSGAPSQIEKLVSKLNRRSQNSICGLKTPALRLKTQSAVSKLNRRSQNPRAILKTYSTPCLKTPPLGLKTPSAVSELVLSAPASARFGPRRGPRVRSDFAIARSRAERLSFEPRQRRKRRGENVPNVKSAPRG